MITSSWLVGLAMATKIGRDDEIAFGKVRDVAREDCARACEAMEL
jgi:hypothetical protein